MLFYNSLLRVNDPDDCGFLGVVFFHAVDLTHNREQVSHFIGQTFDVDWIIEVLAIDSTDVGTSGMPIGELILLDDLVDPVGVAPKLLDSGVVVWTELSVEDGKAAYPR